MPKPRGPATPATAFRLSIVQPDEPSSLAAGLSAEQRRAVGYFLCRTSRDLGYVFPSFNWIKVSVQLAHQEPAMRYAIAALGMMHSARKPFMHSSLASIIDGQTHREALQVYTKAIALMQAYISRLQREDAELSTDVALLSCMLFCCFEHFQGEGAAGCMHMAKGRRMVQERLTLVGSSGGTRGILQSDVLALFDGFDDPSGMVLDRNPLFTNWKQRPRAIPAIAPFFRSLHDADQALQQLDSLRTRINDELIDLASQALETVSSMPSDSAAAYCIQHTLSRTVDISHAEHLTEDIENLQHAYHAWFAAVSNSSHHLQVRSQISALMEIQYLARMISLKMCREPDERIWTDHDTELGRILDLAECCLLCYPSTMATDTNAVMSDSGHSLILSTDLLNHVYLAGIKSRRKDFLDKSLYLFRSADNRATIFQSSVLCTFMGRLTERENKLRQGLVSRADPLASMSAKELSRSALFSDVVFAQVSCRPRCINNIMTRWVYDATGLPTEIEVLEDLYDVIDFTSVSFKTYTIPIPTTCRPDKTTPADSALAWTPELDSTVKDTSFTESILNLEQLEAVLRENEKLFWGPGLRSIS